MNVREAINFGLNKLNFEDVRENQTKVVEAYLINGRDVLMISPTGSGKSLTFYIAPFAIDFSKHGERDDIQTVCLIIFPLVSLMNDQVSSLREKGIKAVVVGSDSSENQNKALTRKPQRANTTLCSQAPKLCLVVIGPRFPH